MTRLTPLLLFFTFVLGGCYRFIGPDGDGDGDGDPTSGEAVEFTDPITGEVLTATKSGAGADGTIGEIAFRTKCGTCHASRDGFDLAFFDFSDHDVIRRGVAHVDTATVLEIRDYIRSLQGSMSTVDRDFEIFRPGNARLSSDVAFAIQHFGEDAWPRDLSVAALLATDPRDIALSVPFPRWSSEDTENDWMAERLLSDDILDADGGMVRSELVYYYDQPTGENLKHLVEAFEAVATRPGFECQGTPGFHPRPLDCFEARRWMASLSATHLLLNGEVRDVPDYLADLWWRVGEAAVSWSLDRGNPGREERDRRRRIAVSWLTLSWVYDPVRYGDNAAYFSEFTKHTNHHRQGALAYAYWLATDPAADDGFRVYDILLQMLVPSRLPAKWFADYTNWMFDRINGWIDQGIYPTTEKGIDDAAAALDVGIRTLDNVGFGIPAEDIDAAKARTQDLIDRLDSLRQIR